MKQAPVVKGTRRDYRTQGLVWFVLQGTQLAEMAQGQIRKFRFSSFRNFGNRKTVNLEKLETSNSHVLSLFVALRTTVCLLVNVRHMYSASKFFSFKVPNRKLILYRKS